MIYCFDLDGTICSSVENSEYYHSSPDKIVVDEINRLYDAGHEIIIMTARGSVSGIDHYDLTEDQLRKWNIKHHKLLMGIKPHAHIFIDDKGLSIDEWKKTIPNNYGVLAGAFDIIHPGYIRMFKQAKLHCTHLTVLLNISPINKITPVQTVDERIEILSAIKYIDNVICYSTEQELHNLLKTTNFDIRFLGSDYINKDFTGKDLQLPIYFIERDHNYSATALKQKIFASINLQFKHIINGDV
jgi:glycerol-3-phosphate cytidylyltransferase